MSMIRRRWKLGALALLALLLAACSGLGGEPVIVATVPPQPTAPPELGYPASPPDMAQGAVIFATRCAECHGDTGAGDGNLVQTGQVQNVPNFLDPAVPGPQRVAEWFATITNGRVEALMPPWRNALTEQERWDVAFYTYTMHASAAQLARGAEVFAENCVGCHGESGRGDGPDAASLSGAVGDLTELGNMSTLSDDAIFETVSEGVGDPNDGMPAFAGKLSEADRRAVISYVRTLALSNVEQRDVMIAGATAQPTGAPAAATANATAAPVEPVATEEASAGRVFTVRGTVMNGTSGSSVPAGLAVSLFIFPPEANPIEIEGAASADATFAFEDVPYLADGAYAVTVTHQDRLFLSAIAGGSALQASPALDVTIYDITDDPSVLTITLIETQINVSGNNLEVAQFIEFTNSSDRAYSTSELTPDGRSVGLRIPLPPGSVVPGFTTPGRYAYLSDQFTVVDTQPVYPGRIHLVQLVYLIPYAGSAIVEQELNYTFNGLDQLLVRPVGVQVVAPDLASMGTTTLAEREFMSFSGTFTRPAGSVRRVELSGSGAGSPSSFGTATTAITGDLAPLLLVGGGLLLGLLLALYIWLRRRNVPPEPPKVTADALARQIAELDASFAAGEIPKKTYDKQRAALKARLTRLLIGGEDE